MVKAASLVRAYCRFEAQPFDFFLEEGLQPLGTQGRAAATRIILGALIDANKNVVRKGRHGRTEGPAFVGPSYTIGSIPVHGSGN